MKTAEEIYESMAAVYESQSGKRLSGDCDMAIRMHAAAAEIEGLYFYCDNIRKQCFPQTAEGEFLDSHAAMRGLRRNGAVKAEGKIRFYLKEAVNTDTAVGAGTVCLTAGGVRFETTGVGVIPAGELFCDVPAAAAEAGSGGNVTAGTVTYMTAAPVGISRCVNMEAFAGGCGSENDESLRARVLASYKTLPNGANKAYYEKTVLGVDGVGAVLVLPKNRGLGTVDIFMTSKDGVPEQALIDEVSALLNSVREICVDVSVSAPESRTVDVAAAVDVEDGYEPEKVRAAAEEKIMSFFDGTLLGKGVTLAKLGNLIYGVDGVKNYSISAPAEDLTAEDGILPVAGTVTISGWGQ